MRLGVRSLLCAVAALLAMEAPADASFPGQNGKIAFESDRSGAYEIYTVDPDDTDLTRLTFSGGRQPAWSPEGTKIAFVRAGNLWLMNADGSNQHSLGLP